VTPPVRTRQRALACAGVEVWRGLADDGRRLHVNARGGGPSLWTAPPGNRFAPAPIVRAPFAAMWRYLENLPQPAHPDLARERAYVADARDRAARRTYAGRGLWAHTFGNRDVIGAGSCDGFVVAIDPTGSLDAFTSRGATTNGGAIAALCSAGAAPIGDRSDLAALARVRGDAQGPLLAPVLVALA